MSMFVRLSLTRSPLTIFQRDSQRSDLLDISKTQTYLIELLSHMVMMGWAMEFTAIRTDHHDDSGLAPPPDHIGTHAHGWAADCWPLRTPVAGDYLDPADPRFQKFLTDLANAPALKQIGLAGAAQTSANVAAAGPTVFDDDGADHIHISARPE